MCLSTVTGLYMPKPNFLSPYKLKFESHEKQTFILLVDLV